MFDFPMMVCMHGFSVRLNDGNVALIRGLARFMFDVSDDHQVLALWL